MKEKYNKAYLRRGLSWEMHRTEEGKWRRWWWEVLEEETAWQETDGRVPVLGERPEIHALLPLDFPGHIPQ